MKKISLLVFLITSSFSFAQIQGYGDLSVKLTNENKLGTARSMSMKNAFGALGGDLSAIAVNPAGTGVFNQSSASMTLNYSNLDFSNTFYNTTTKSNQENFLLSQIGAVLVFENDGYSNNEIKKVNFGINYQKVNDYRNNWTSKGLLYSTLSDDIPETSVYNEVDKQQYDNKSFGTQSELNLSLGMDFDDKLYVGASFNSRDFEFDEKADRYERSYNAEGDYIDAVENFWHNHQGSGFSLGIGAIFKPVHELRLGIAYQSPTWYEIHEESNVDEYNVGYQNFYYSYNDHTYENDYDNLRINDYYLRTPSKLTLSVATVVDKFAVMSIDVVRHDYKGLKLTPYNTYINENENFENDLKNTFTFNVGSEFRFDDLSLRGGYSYAQDPYENAIETDNLQGYALGLGYNFGNVVLDAAYDYNEQTGYFNYYGDIGGVEGAALNKEKSRFMATLNFKF
jgi:hypothetical protein